METAFFDKEIKVMYVEASSFPNGVLAAHQTLHKMIPYSNERKYLGISRPENGTIIYKAGAEEIIPGEAEKLGLNIITLPKGKYACMSIHDYMKDIPSIGNAFTQLTNLPNIDPQGYCVEWYISETDVKCMVRLID